MSDGSDNHREEDSPPNESKQKSSDQSESGGLSQSLIDENDREKSFSLMHRIRFGLTLLLALALVVSLAGVIYIALTPQQATDPYTEFYILGTEGNASNYPTNLTIGEQAEVIIGVVNHEQVEMTYTVVIRANNKTLNTETLILAHGKTSERSMTYSLNQTGRTKVQFHLYRGREPDTNSEPYRSLRLWTNVSRSSRYIVTGEFLEPVLR